MNQNEMKTAYNKTVSSNATVKAEVKKLSTLVASKNAKDVEAIINKIAKISFEAGVKAVPCTCSKPAAKKVEKKPEVKKAEPKKEVKK